MTSVVENIAFDCADTYALGQFWSQVVGHPRSPEDKPGDSDALIERVRPTRVPSRGHWCWPPVPEDQAS